MDDLKQATLSAATRPDLRAAVEALYAQLAQDIAARKPRCDASGKCCHFDAYGHRLYITTAELATFVHSVQHHPVAPTPPPPPPTHLAILNPQSGGCPYQVDNLCSVHPIRPFGCRIFFCDPSATAWQQDRYEHYHAQIKRLHAQFDVPYYYVEWRAALRALDLLP
jgi:Fe-S-cluster containining protein